MKELDLISERANFRDGLMFVSAELRGAAAAAASAAGLAMLAFVLAVMPPVSGSGVMASVSHGINAAALA